MRLRSLAVLLCSVAMTAPAASTVSAAAKSTAVPAFPGAEGAGRLALGGRGGRVIKVTNLEDSGPGSLRSAIDATEPRTVVFEVSGTIALASPLRIRSPRITIAGQSAPGDGITLRNQPLIVEADDVVIRYLRSRLGDEGRAESDAIWVTSGRRIILDHVSASWSIDETLSVNNGFRDPAKGFYDVTVQWSIISESLNRSLHVKGAHGYGSLIAGGFGTRISFHHNLWAHHFGRNPRPGNPAQPERDSVGAFHDYRSNVFYNWGGDHAGYNADTGALKRSIVRYNFVDNTYIPGSASTGRIAFNESNELAQAYFAGNTMAGELPADPWSLTSGKNGASWRLTKPVDVAPVTPEPAASAHERVLANAGASLVRDAVDLRVVQSVRDRSGGLIDSQKDVGGWPELKSLPPFLDGDNDGMPDHWERAHALNLAADDSAGDADGDGYTNLEEYLNGILDAARITPRASINGTAYPSLSAAVEALPETGGEILLAPGEYRQKVTIAKSGVTLRGTGRTPAEVTVVWGDSAATAGGTVKSASLNVTGDDFRAENLTIANDYQYRVVPQSQAVALSVTGDRAVFERVRLLGAQDTLHAATRKCASDPCPTSRQVFRDCYIEGHVDFIFGDSKAYFERCRLHAIAHREIMITAHARTSPDQDRAYVFDRCRITSDAGAESIYFGRPWRDYARVIFLDTQLDAAIHPEGWREWTPGKTDRLKLAYYAEHGSKGLNAKQDTREPHAVRLSAAESRKWRKWGHSLFPSKRGRASTPRTTEPYTVARGLFDQREPDLGLPAVANSETVTIFKPKSGAAQFNNGTVLIPFKGKLYAQWQSSPKDEDSQDTWVAYSVSDDGRHWSAPAVLAPVAAAPQMRSNGGWWTDGATLVAYIIVWPTGFQSGEGGYTDYILSTDGQQWSAPRRVTGIDGQPVAGIIEQDPHLLPGGRILTAFHTRPGLIVAPFYTDDPLGLNGWQRGRMQNLPHDAGVSRELEPSVFLRGSCAVMVFRDQASTYRQLAAESCDAGETWATPALTAMPDSRAKQSAGNLPDGSAYLVNAPRAEKLRIPLAITLSRAGRHFDRSYLLRGAGSLQPLRFEGRYKRPGFHYPKSVIWKDHLYVGYSTNKEDIELTRVPLAELTAVAPAQ